MPIELIRLGLGLLIALFHRPIADYMLRYERVLVVAFRQRGVPLPPPPTSETCRNVYFALGIFLAVFEIFRIWLMLHHPGSLTVVVNSHWPLAISR